MDMFLDAMRVPRIYLPAPLTADTLIPLSEACFHHVARVLRLKAGANVVLFNGEGGEFHGVLDQVTRRSAMVRLQRFVAREVEAPLKILLAQGISRGERMDYTLQKAVELGVDAILPLVTERSTVALQDERLGNRVQHWQKIIISACEQCGRNRLPQLLAPITLAKWLPCHLDVDLKLVLDPSATRGLKSSVTSARALALLIGPEGGFSAQELRVAKVQDFLPVRLGPRILRTETAAVAALAALQVLTGDLG